MRFQHGRPAAVSTLALAVLSACAPALDWRQAHLEGGGVAMLFPCRPDRHERTVRLGGIDSPMQMHSCRAAQAFFSVAWVDAVEPGQVAALLDDLRGHAVANISGASAPSALIVPGATPNERSGMLRIEGRLPDGGATVEHAAFFVKGLRVYQATILGAAVTAEEAETFFGAIRITP